MLNLLLKNGKTIQPAAVGPGWIMPQHVVWIDLLNPTREEELLTEAALGLSLPTREEMAEIEISSRLYREDDGVFMTASLLAHSEADMPQIGPVTFVLAKGRLVTIRYIEPRSFILFEQQLDRDSSACSSGAGAFLGLLDVVIDRLADILERAVADVETLSVTIFNKPENINFRRMMDSLGKAHGINAKIRESAASLMRMLIYASGSGALKGVPEGRDHLTSLQQDLASLTDQSGYLSGNITFLLDASLGLINIEQNSIIKIFSVAAVVFLPPTLVASYFGMNFKHMDAFNWPGGEAFALCLMVASVIAPLLWFKRKGWL